MKKLKYVLFLLLIVLSFDVKAEDRCDKDELARLKALANKVEFDYDYKLVDEKAVFSINAVNLNEDLKVLIIEDYLNDNYKEFKDNSEHKATLDGFEPGERVTVTIKGYVPNWCSGKTVLTKTVKLPYYNYFYSEEKCKGYEDFKYCKQLVDGNITEKEFEKQFETYKKNKEKNETPIVEPAKDNTNMYMIIGGAVIVVVIITVVVILIIKRKRRYSL